MKKSIFMVALAAMSLASCSNDSVVEVPQPDEIKFNVVAANAGRAANVYSASNKMEQFSVYAAFQLAGESTHRSYIEGDVIKKEGPAWNNQSTSTRYWADGGHLDFYAVAGLADNKFTTWAAGSKPTVAFTVNNDVTKQEDLLYAVKMNATKENGVVNLNFRHGLSQIVFNAVNMKNKLYVKVKGIEVIGKFVTNGTLTLPGADTDATLAAANQGTWVNGAASTTDVTYVAYANANGEEIACKQPNDPAVNLTNDNAGNGSMLLIPQEVEGWTPDEVGKNSIYDKAVVKVDCEIWNVAGAKFDPDKDVPLHIGKAVLPLNANWEQGRKYTYTLVFGGTAAPDETPGPGGYEEDSKDPKDPTPILETISFSVTVDDFADGEKKEVDVTPEN